LVKQEVFVDRTRSGNISFDEKFPGRQAGPLLPAGGKQVSLHIFVDRSSVEVFVNDGSTVISDAIFPSRDSQDIELYSKGGEARIVKLEVCTCARPGDNREDLPAQSKVALPRYFFLPRIRTLESWQFD